ncbi:acylphosphatase [groundwater metagenome]
MKRIHVFVSGEVQGVGYREEVKRLAFGLNIFGCVKNLEDGRVEITAEGEDKNIEEFLDRIHIKRYPIFVVDIEVEEESYKGEFKSFKVIRDKDVQKEMLSALSRGTVEIHEVREILEGVRQDTSHIPEIRTNTKIMLEKQDTTIHMLERISDDTSDMKSTLARIEGKQDKMLEKQDATVHILERVGEDTSDMKSTLLRIEGDVKDTKFSLSSFIEEKYQKLEGEIADIKATLARMQAAG